MPYGITPQENLAGGLNLRDQPVTTDPSQAIDLENVDFTPVGAVRQRAGTAQFSADALPANGDSMIEYRKADGTQQLVVGAGGNLRVLSAAGATVNTETGPTTGPHYFARFAAPGSEHLYAANGTDTLRRWDGSTWTTPAFTGLTPTGRHLAVQSQEARLVNARLASQVSRVHFSAAGDPLTWDVNDYVDLDPGDGEEIMALVAWRNYVFAFKQTKYFVFYGNTVGDTGRVEFSKNAVNVGIGCAAIGAAVAGRDGVYFLGDAGIYQTDGGGPQLISGVLDPLFQGGSPAFYEGQMLDRANRASARLAYHGERLWMAYRALDGSTNNRVLVHEPRYGWWSVYSLPASALVGFDATTEARLAFCRATGGDRVDYHARSQTSDRGTAISSRWQSAWTNFDIPEAKTIREAEVWGSGTCRFSLARDYGYETSSEALALELGDASDVWGDGSGPDLWGDGTSAADTWGPNFAVENVMYRNAIRGKDFSSRITNNVLDTTWSVHRIHHHLRERRVPGVRKTELAGA